MQRRSEGKMSFIWIPRIYYWETESRGGEKGVVNSEEEEGLKVCKARGVKWATTFFAAKNFANKIFAKAFNEGLAAWHGRALLHYALLHVSC